MSTGRYVRPASQADATSIDILMLRGETITRHMDWLNTRDWMLKPDTLLLFEGSDLLAMLVIPEEPSGIRWLRLLVHLPFIPPQEVWLDFWHYIKQQPFIGCTVAVIAQNNQLARYLLDCGWEQKQSIVFLSKQIGNTEKQPETFGDVILRAATQMDLLPIAEIDQASFVPLWRNGTATLEAGMRSNSYTTVAILDGVICGYQLSNFMYTGLHLARLAVMPDFQARGVGHSLLNDLTRYAASARCDIITVNTQNDNHRSLALYERNGFERNTQQYPVLQFQF